MNNDLKFIPLNVNTPALPSPASASGKGQGVFTPAEQSVSGNGPGQAPGNQGPEAARGVQVPATPAARDGEGSRSPAEGRSTKAQQKAIEEAVSQLNEFVQSVQRDLKFEVDKETGKTVVTVLDSETGEVIRQIPDELALKLARSLQQDEPLTLFSAKA